MPPTLDAVTLQFIDGVSVTGGATAQKFYYEDAWSGSVATKSYNVSTLGGVTLAKRLHWSLKNAAGDDMGGVVTHASDTDVTFTFMENLSAANYYVIGR